MSEKTAYPLSWPDGWKRTTNRVRAQFKKRNLPNLPAYDAQNMPIYRSPSRLSVSDAVKRVIGELTRMGIKDDDILISTNVRLRLDGLPRSDQEPSDPGAAVYWRKKNQAMRCMAIDQYTRVADNLAAIAATLEAMRAIERHGGATILERAFLGFAALPEKATAPWRETLGFSNDEPVTSDAIESKFRDLVKKHHPDYGGNEDTFRKIVDARTVAKREVTAA